MKIIAIAAVGKNGVIAKGQDLPWTIPEDMKFFRDSTRDHIVIMGRKTYQALGSAMPKRKNAVITRDQNFKLVDAKIFHDLNDAIAFYKNQKELAAKTIFIIGGAEIYKLSIPLLDEVWLTEIDSEFDGDVFFPYYQHGKFERPEFSQSVIKNQQDFTGSSFHYRFLKYTKFE